MLDESNLKAKLLSQGTPACLEIYKTIVKNIVIYFNIIYPVRGEVAKISQDFYSIRDLGCFKDLEKIP